MDAQHKAALKSALTTLRPLHRRWRTEFGTDRLFWDALVTRSRTGESDANGLPVLPLPLLPMLYEALSTPGKQQGVFYTPTPLADFLTGQTLGRYLAAQYRACLRHPEQTAERLAAVLALKILDPACGAGVFLLAALTRLTAFYHCLDRSGLALSSVQREVLRHPAHYAVTHQLYGVDVDAVAILLARAQLRARAEELDGCAVELPEGSVLVRVGNALSSPGASQTEEDFDWTAAFSGVAQWDFVLGNPPYMTEVRGASGLFDTLRNHPHLAQVYDPKMDLCDAFLALSMALLRPGGQLGLVLPEYWMSRSGGRLLRAHLWRSGTVARIWTLGNRRMFARAPGHHSSLLIWEKAASADGAPAATLADARPCRWGDGVLDCQPPVARLHYRSESGQLLLARPEILALLEKLARQPLRLQSREIQQGIVMPQAVLRKADWARLPDDVRPRVAPGCGIFTLTHDEVAGLNLTPWEQAALRPYYTVADLPLDKASEQPEEARWLIYADQALLSAMEATPERYGNLRRHLDRFSAINTSAHAPYGLHRPRQPVWFEDPEKILAVRQTVWPQFVVASQPAYVGEGFYILRAQQSALQGRTQALAAVLNSTVSWCWLYHHKRKGARLQVDKDVLLGLPLPELPRAEALSELEVQSLYGLSTSEMAVLETFRLEVARPEP